MSEIDKMPPNCHDCPYWEIAEPPYVCWTCLKKLGEKDNVPDTNVGEMSSHKNIAK